MTQKHSTGLDLYARIEPLIPFQDEIRRLYSTFIKKLQKEKPGLILDIGCGGGNFMKMARDMEFEIEGIDLSPAQVAVAKAAGLTAENKDIREVTKTYDTIVAVFDVLNYLDDEQLAAFLIEVKRVLKPGGKFYADINSLHGFEEVAPGSLLLHGDGTYGSLESGYGEGILDTTIRLFSKKGELYEKEEEHIIQFYHPLERIRKVNPFKTLTVDNLTLYAKKPDKFLLTFFD
jgi:SAM-dependent methyltransferase